MSRKKEQERMRELVSEVVTTLCKSSLSYQHEFSIEGLLGITVDNDDILLININKCVEKARGQGAGDPGAYERPTPVKRRANSDHDDSSIEREECEAHPQSSKRSKPEDSPGSKERSTGSAIPTSSDSIAEFMKLVGTVDTAPTDMGTPLTAIESQVTPSRLHKEVFAEAMNLGSHTGTPPPGCSTWGTPTDIASWYQNSSGDGQVKSESMSSDGTPSTIGKRKEARHFATDLQTGIKEINATVKCNKYLLNKILETIGGEPVNDMLETDAIGVTGAEDIPLPVKNLDDFEDLEIWLSEDKINQKALENRLALIGGSTLKENTKNLVNAVLSHEVQLLFNWAGKTGWKNKGNIQRRALAPTHICRVITQAVLRNRLLYMNTVADVHKEIMLYLRNALDRCGGRKRRMMEKARQVVAEFITEAEEAKYMGGESNESMPPLPSPKPRYMAESNEGMPPPLPSPNRYMPSNEGGM